MKPMLLVQGPVATRSGYGEHARDLIRALVSIDKWDVKVINTRWGNTPMNALNEKNPKDKVILDRILKEDSLPKQPDVHIQISVPNEFSPLAKYNIGITAGIENTAPKPEWIECLNRMDMNIVPSKFVKQVFESVTYEKMD